jgi:hypothetical protein
MRSWAWATPSSATPNCGWPPTHGCRGCGVIGELGFQRTQAPLVHVAVAGVVGAALGVVVVRDEPNQPWAANQCIDGQVGCYRASSRSA